VSAGILTGIKLKRWGGLVMSLNTVGLSHAGN